MVGRAFTGPAGEIGDGLERPCPKCEAKRGWRCARTSAIGVRTVLKKVHPERRAAR